MRLPSELESWLIPARSGLSIRSARSLLRWMGYCPLCDLDNAMRGAGVDSARSRLERSHLPHDRLHGSEFEFTCREHNLDATTDRHVAAGARMADRLRRFLKEKRDLPPSRWAGVASDLGRMMRLREDPMRVHRILEEIRFQYRLDVRQFKVYATIAARALYRGNECQRAYDLLRLANKLRFRECPIEIQLELQVELANCLRRLGHARASAGVFFASARCALLGGVRFENFATDPALRVGETAIPAGWEAEFGAIVEAARDSRMRGLGEEASALLRYNLVRLDRDRQSDADLRRGEDALRNLDAFERRHRQGNLLQEHALSCDDAAPEAAERLGELAEQWSGVSPFHSALAEARSAMAWIGFRTVRSPDHDKRLLRARECLERARLGFDRVDNDAFYDAVSHALHQLELATPSLGVRTDGLEKYVLEARALRSSGVSRYLRMPGPILVAPDDWRCLDASDLRTAEEIGFLPSVRFDPVEDLLVTDSSWTSRLNWY